MSSKPTRVLVVEDSAVQHRMLVSLFESDPELAVVGWASNGQEAIEAAYRLKPDVITMDLQMPVMDGLEASRHIMRETPTPIVVVTGTMTAENHDLVRELLTAGVLEIATKPLPGPEGEVAAQALVRTVKGMAQVKVVRRWTPTPLLLNPPKATHPPQIIAIGASTGGPQALLQVLSQLPADFPIPILVVQHIAPGFEGTLVDWLAPLCALPVRLAATQLTSLPPGIYIAPSNCHLLVREKALAFSDAPLYQGHRPSITMLFRSMASAYGARAIGVLLTGMGEDGAEGLRDLKRAGGMTVVQDEASSVIFGMPAAAIALGASDYVLPPAAIGGLLRNLVLT